MTKNIDEHDTYAQALAQIEELKKRAESLRANELQPTIDRFKRAVSLYGIRPIDVFSEAQLSGAYYSESTRIAQSTHSTHGAHGAQNTQGVQSAKIEATFSAPVADQASKPPAQSAQPTAPSGARAAKYANANGATWTGHGRRPQWFIEATEKGVTPESMLIAGGPHLESSAPGAQAAQPAQLFASASPANATNTTNPAQPARPVQPAQVAPGAHEPKRRGRPPGSTNKNTVPTDSRAPAASSVAPKRRGRPLGSTNKNKGAEFMSGKRDERSAAVAAVASGSTGAAAVPRGYRMDDKYWTGIGPRPRWFKEAMAAGKTMSELRAT